MAIREGRWDCDQCGTRKVRGRDMECPGCGRKRAENTKFYLAEGEPEVTDASLVQRAKKGADWYCEHCQSGNQADQSSCTQCAAARGTSPAAPVRVYAPGDIPRDGKEERLAPLPSATLEPSETSDLASSIYPSHDSAPESNRTWLAAGAVALVVGLVAFLLWPRHVTLQVTGFSWHREVSVQKYATVTEEDWDVPNGGRVLSSRVEIRSYVSVLDHYETHTREVSEEVCVGTESYVSGSRDLGNGFFEDEYSERPVYETRYHTETYEEPVYRDEPVYDTKYRYDIDKWVNARTEQSAGHNRDDPAPHWPEFALAGDGSATIGNERESGRSETYMVYFLSQGEKQEKYEEKVDRAAWDAYDHRGLYTAKVSVFGKLSDIQPLTNENNK